MWKKAFSLVEASIAILVVALAAAGVSVGATMLEESRVKKMIGDIASYEGNYETFYSLYDAVPGDFDKATTFWSNCAEVNSYCNGNGNKMIEHGENLLSDEVVMATRHMSLAKLEKFNTGELTTSYDGSVEPGKNIPKAPISGTGYFFSGGRSVINNSSNYLAPFVETINAVYIGAPENHGAPIAGGIRPMIAKVIDEKMDDGRALSGKIRARAGKSYNLADCADGDAYNGNFGSNACLLGAAFDYVKESNDESYRNALYQVAMGVINENALMNIPINPGGGPPRIGNILPCGIPGGPPCPIAPSGPGSIAPDGGPETPTPDLPPIFETPSVAPPTSEGGGDDDGGGGEKPCLRLEYKDGSYHCTQYGEPGEVCTAARCVRGVGCKCTETTKTNAECIDERCRGELCMCREFAKESDKTDTNTDSDKNADVSIAYECDDPNGRGTIKVDSSFTAKYSNCKPVRP